MVQVGAAIISRDHRVLACQRRAAGTHPGKWEFPGGKRDRDETVAGCVARELREELGIAAVIGPEVWRSRHRYPGREPVEIFFFRVSSYAGRMTNLAFADVRWLALEQLPTLDFLDADRPLVTWLATSGRL